MVLLQTYNKKGVKRYFYRTIQRSVYGGTLQSHTESGVQRHSNMPIEKSVYKGILTGVKRRKLRRDTPVGQCREACMRDG
jgi:CRISPR/Cas system-associated endoribonuclease Cas2